MRLENGEVLLLWPLALHVLTAGYYYNSGGLHQAIDLRTNQDGSIIKPVYAAESGTVDQVQAWDGHTRTGMQSYGNMVRIKHADYNGKTLQTRYAHLSSYCVAQGETVEEGQLIGYTGQTGNVYGAHLHFEVIWDGVRRNPLVWLDEDFTLATGSEYTYGAGEHGVTRPAEQEAPAAAGKLQRMCIVGEDPDIAAKAAELGLAVQTVTAQLIGPASEGDAMAIWQLCKAEGCRYFASERAGGLQQLCVVDATDKVLDRARTAVLPIEQRTCSVIGPASSGDAMAVWGKAQASDNMYFSSYTEV